MNETSRLNNILGMNKRNLLYLRPANKKRYVRIADNKLATKQLLHNAEISSPELFVVITHRRELINFQWDNLPASFVLKPNLGFGGSGILISYGKKKNGNWVGQNSTEISQKDLIDHCSNILDGNFSISNVPDMAFFEERIQLDSFMKPYTFKGIPDIRVIVYNHVPIMAMLRLPTRRSGGKANLHQGSVGVGIDIANGITTHAIVKGVFLEKIIDVHPDTRAPLRGIRLPNWKSILIMAVKTAMMSNLGYCGVDIALGKTGPTVLEVNARPGLSIQNANRASLDDRLKRIRGLKITTPERGVKIAQDLFGGEIEHEIEGLSGKQIIGLAEKIHLFGKGKIERDVEVKIDTGADLTSLDTTLAEELGFAEIVKIFHDLEETGKLTTMSKEEIRKLHKDIVDVKTITSSHGETKRLLIPITFYLAGIKMVTKASIIDRKNLAYQMIIGNQDLKNFLVDTTKSLLRKQS